MDYGKLGLKAQKSDPQTKTSRDPRETRSDTRDSPTTGSKTGEPCAQVGKDPNTPAAEELKRVWYLIHLYVMFTRPFAWPELVQ